MEQKRGKGHITLQFTTEILIYFKMFDNIFLCSDLTQPEILSVCDVLCSVSTM